MAGQPTFPCWLNVNRSDLWPSIIIYCNTFRSHEIGLSLLTSTTKQQSANISTVTLLMTHDCGINQGPWNKTLQNAQHGNSQSMYITTKWPLFIANYHIIASTKTNEESLRQSCNKIAYANKINHVTGLTPPPNTSLLLSCYRPMKSIVAPPPATAGLVVALVAFCPFSLFLGANPLKMPRELFQADIHKGSTATIQSASKRLFDHCLLLLMNE